MRLPSQVLRRRLLVYGAITVAILSLRYFFWPGVNISVTNETGAEIVDVEIRFAGGRESRPRLQSGASFATRVRSRGESDLKIEFRDAAGQPHSQPIDVYFERGYRGTITIRIRPDGTALWKDETKVGATLPFGL